MMTRPALTACCALLFACSHHGSSSQSTATASAQQKNTASPSASSSDAANTSTLLSSAPSAPLDPHTAERIDAAVRQALHRGDTPGAVLLIAASGRTLFHKAYGFRAKRPEERPMTPDTLFDMASLTKAIVTSTCIVLLIEQGLIRLNDRIASHLPELSSNTNDGRDEITIEHLLLHTSGLISSSAQSDYTQGLSKALVKIHAQRLLASPGTRYEYSDLGYIILGALVERKTGQSLDVFAQKHLFGPLGMRDTLFLPGDPQQKWRTALTESVDGHFVAGQVHDPRARLLGGIAGNAGLFSTAEDLSRFAFMLMNGGKYHRVDPQSGTAGERIILSPDSIRLLMEARALPNEGHPPATKQRTLGWEVRPPITDGRKTQSNLGHTGFTGTSVWMYPEVKGAVILLTNRLHPDGKGNISRLRGEIASLVAPVFLAMDQKNAASPPISIALPEKSTVLSGLDILKRDGFSALKHKRIGLVAHPASISADGRNIIDLLKNTKDIHLQKLFSPEHGLTGDQDSAVHDANDPKTGLPVVSLYGPRTRPRKEDLNDIDTVLVDLQDVGCRFYTYMSTLGYLLESAALYKKPIYVIDRPNPIGGVAVEGPLPEKESFTAYHPIPVRHGMTLGELARLLNAERKIGADLHIIEMEGYKRSMLFSGTRLPWQKPSPNIKTPLSALLYPGIGLLETTNISVGRGTDRPFQKLGAPFIDGRALAKQLEAFSLRGVTIHPIEFRPESSTYAGQQCGGIEIEVADPNQLSPVRIGLSIAHALRKLYASEWKVLSMQTLLANTNVLQSIQKGEHPDQIIAAYQSDVDAFMAVRKKYLIYTD